MPRDDEPVTSWLQAAAQGDREAEERAAAWAYGELERLAAQRLRRAFGGADVTLEPAALVNETFLKVLESPVAFANRRHLFAFLGTVMMRVLIDYQRSRSAGKRGGDAVRIGLTGVHLGEPAAGIDLLAFEEALERLEALDARKAEVVRMRVLWGLSTREIAPILEVSEPTARRDWRFARTWLAEVLEL